MRLRLRVLLPINLLLFCVGCDIIDPGDCVAIAGYALNVTVRDSVSGGPPPSGTLVIARDGTYADSMTAGVPGSTGSTFPLAIERPGTYLVTVEAEGYRLWSRSGIVVERSSAKCHQIQTVTVLARLQH